jgi:hypothetical protein
MRLPVGDGFHDLTVSLVSDAQGHIREIAFVRRGKPGGTLDQMFIELGVMLSRALQGRSPETGEAVS